MIDGKTKILLEIGKKHQKFKTYSFIGGLVVILSLFLTIMRVSFNIKEFYFDQNLWNLLFSLGLAILAISFIFYQIKEHFWDETLRELYKERIEIEVDNRRKQIATT